MNKLQEFSDTTLGFVMLYWVIVGIRKLLMWLDGGERNWKNSDKTKH